MDRLNPIDKPKQLTDNQINLLKSPLPSAAVTQHPTKKYLSTIKAIYVIERFNDVFGLGGWHIQNEVVEAGAKNIVVKSRFEAPEYGIVVPDIFGGNDNADRGDAFKGACTDALTKIGSYLYVGMDVFKGLTDRGNTQKPKTATQTQDEVQGGTMPQNANEEPAGAENELLCAFEGENGEACLEPITVAEDRYSRRMYKRPLCRNCQSKVKNAQHGGN